MQQQFGGTLLGLIVGLLLGLGLALGVAVYVTKVPVPFVDRGVQRKPDQDALESERNKRWNPNADLATAKPPTLATPAPAAPDNAPPSAPAPTAAPAPAVAAPAPTPSAPVAAPKPTAKSNDPLGTLIQQRADVTPPTAKAEGDPFLYFVQAGAFRNAEEAEAQRAKLAMLGFDAKVSEREQAGRAVFRVRLGPFQQKTDADHATERLTGQGVDAALVRVQR